MNLLALDLGTTLGWAHRERSGTITSGSELFSPRRQESSGQRYMKFTARLSELFRQHGPFDSIYYEEVKAHGQGQVLAAHMYGGFEAMLQTWCIRNGVRLVGVGVGTVKKHWTGKGNATKGMMIEFAEAHGFKVKDDNQADALAILSFAVMAEGLEVISVTLRQPNVLSLANGKPVLETVFD